MQVLLLPLLSLQQCTCCRSNTACFCFFILAPPALSICPCSFSACSTSPAAFFFSFASSVLAPLTSFASAESCAESSGLTCGTNTDVAQNCTPGQHSSRNKSGNQMAVIYCSRTHHATFVDKQLLGSLRCTIEQQWHAQYLHNSKIAKPNSAQSHHCDMNAAL